MGTTASSASNSEGAVDGLKVVVPNEQFTRFVDFIVKNWGLSNATEDANECLAAAVPDHVDDEGSYSSEIDDKQCHTTASARFFVIKRRESVPPVPDVSLVWETLDLEAGRIDKLLVRAGVFVDSSQVMAEHGSFSAYRKRLLWQMVKRRWFAALTEETTSAFNTKSFLEFIAATHSHLWQELSTDPAVGPFARRGAVQLLFKGGNVVNMVKGAAGRLLLSARLEQVSEAKRLAAALAPAGISDVDFYLLLDYYKAPELCDSECFSAVHLAARAAVKRGMRDIALPKEWVSSTTQSTSFHKERLGKSLTLAIDSLVSDLKVFGDPRRVDAQPLLVLSREASLTCEPAERCDILIRQEQSEVELTFVGEPKRAYISDNEIVEHRDARCITEDDVCAFSLVRLLCGFSVAPATSAATSALKELGIGDSSPKSSILTELGQQQRILSKGEGIDVSFPLQHDVNLALWCQAERLLPCSFVHEATIVNQDLPYRLSCESLDALILEQRDLTFGKRSHNLLIWRVAKAIKRLRRLIELLGIKLFASSDATWHLKSRGLDLIQKRLANFVSHSLHRRKKESHTPIAYRSRTKRRTFSVAGNSLSDRFMQTALSEAPNSSSKAEEKKSNNHCKSTSVPVSMVTAARDLDFSTSELEACSRLFHTTLVSAALLLPLEHLALRVFADDSALPGDFSAKWAAVLEPLIDLVVVFRDTAKAFASMPQSEMLDIRETHLYTWAACVG